MDNHLKDIWEDLVAKANHLKDLWEVQVIFHLKVVLRAVLRVDLKVAHRPKPQKAVNTKC